MVEQLLHVVGFARATEPLLGIEFQQLLNQVPAKWVYPLFRVVNFTFDYLGPHRLIISPLERRPTRDHFVDYAA